MIIPESAQAHFFLQSVHTERERFFFREEADVKKRKKENCAEKVGIFSE